MQLGGDFYLTFPNSNLYVSQAQLTLILISNMFLFGLGTIMGITVLVYLQALHLDVAMAKKLS